MIEQLEKYIEAALATLAALLAWCWRIARIDANRQARIEWLEQWRKKHSEFAGKQADRLDEVERRYERVDVKLDNIDSNVAEIKQSLRDITKSRRVGGSRWYDPPEEQP